MERILYFDCFAGISGDMSIGALIDLGLDSAQVTAELKKLAIGGYTIEINKVNRFAISGTDVKVSLIDAAQHKYEAHHDHKHEVHHEHKHEVHHEHSHPHTQDGQEERNLADITKIINQSEISNRSKELAVGIFTEIAKAEAVVHGKSLEDVHFHEVGAIDSIVDIVGVAVCIDLLKVDKIYCSPVHEGQGFVNCRHGRLPIPVPAVIKMMEGSNISMITEDIQAELVTPTGFGILKTLSMSCGKMPTMKIEKVGYGFGKTDTGSLNALRVVLGTNETEEKSIIKDQVVLLETNIDDTTSEVLGYTMSRLLDAGALDVYFTPIQMKKNRPAQILSVICKEEQAEELGMIIFAETTTIGIRRQTMDRMVLNREIKMIMTDYGEVKAKLVSVNGLERVQPEYEDCLKIAKENNITLQEVYEIVKRCQNGK